jgi:hypothetical protein
MSYRQVSREELEEYLKRNPGGTYRVNGQEVTPQKTYGDEDQGALMKILTSVSKPLRAIPASVAAAISGDENYENPFLTARERDSFKEDPTMYGTKAAAGLGAYLIPGGGGAATTVGGRIGTAAARGAGAGALSGFSASDEEDELESILKGAGLGGVIGGGIQAGGEALKGLRGAKTSGQQQYINTNEVDDIAKLPSKTRKGLAKQAKSAGFWDSKISESQNIKNYLTNRGLAGNTPAETLEKMTQEFKKAQGLKQEGLDEIGGLSKSYIDKIKSEIDESVIFSGLGDEETAVVQKMKEALDKAPRDAKTLDKIAQKWYDRGLTLKGDMKASQSGLYKFGAKAIRDNLKVANQGGSYTEGMSTLSRILGLQDEGQVAKTAAQAADVGMDLPLFAGAGFRGADVKTPMVREVIDKTRAAQGRALEQGVSPLSGILQGAGQAGGVLAPIGRAAQRVGPAIAGQLQGQQPEPQMQQVQPMEGSGLSQAGLAQDEVQAIKQMLAMEMLSGNISATEAKAVVDLLGLGEEEQASMTEGQRDYKMAADAMTQAYNILEQGGGAGKIPTALGNVAGFFGSTTPSSEYKSSLDTATAFLRKALIGTGQSEAELKNLNLPKPTDEPAIARQKIEALIPLLYDRAGL